MTLRLYDLSISPREYPSDGGENERPTIHNPPLSQSDQQIWSRWFHHRWRDPEEFRAWFGYCTPNAILKRLEQFRRLNAFSKYEFLTPCSSQEIAIFGVREGHWWLLAQWRIDAGPPTDFADVVNDVKAESARETAIDSSFRILIILLSVLGAGGSAILLLSPAHDLAGGIATGVISGVLFWLAAAMRSEPTSQ